MKLKLSNAVDLYHQELSSVQMKSNASIESYMRQLNAFINYLKDNNVEIVNDITKDAVDDYLYRYSMNHEPASTNQAIATLKSFYRYLNSSFNMDDICSNLTVKKNPDKTKKYFSDEQIDALLTIHDDTNLHEVCDVTIFDVIYGCGLRVSEACNLMLNDVHLDQEYIKVTGKGNKQRLIPLSQIASNRLITYVNEIRCKLDAYNDQHLFLTMQGKPLSRDYLSKRLKKRLFDLNIIENGDLSGYSMHSLRHSFASHMINNDTSTRIVQEMLGHASLATTQIYTHKTVDQLQEEYNEYMPRK